MKPLFESASASLHHLNIKDHNIAVSFRTKAVQIQNDTDLKSLVKLDAKSAPTELANAIKNQYFDLFQQPLNISTDSLAVEIIGHVYGEEFAAMVERISPLKWLDLQMEKIINHAAVIDAGEREVDDNRKFWDKIAPFRSLFENLLPTPA